VSLTREQILASRKDRKPTRIDVPEWGGEVYIRVLSAQDQMQMSEGTKPQDMPITVILHCLVDENGERILQDDDFDALAQEDFPVIMRVFSQAARLNGLSTKELDEAIDRFEPAPDESSSTA
jgi:hypothetical protein